MARPLKRSQSSPSLPLEVCLPASQLADILDVPIEDVSSMRTARIMKEFTKGFHFLKSYGKAATFFGSSRVASDSFSYREAEQLAGDLVKECFAVITGGGPGIREAASRGEEKAGGHSVGLNIE